MARFASECRDKMNELTARLENTLGPDTADLSMRFGLNSGPVTAGVLRGKNTSLILLMIGIPTGSPITSSSQVTELASSCLGTQSTQLLEWKGESMSEQAQECL